MIRLINIFFLAVGATNVNWEALKATYIGIDYDNPKHQLAIDIALGQGWMPLIFKSEFIHSSCQMENIGTVYMTMGINDHDLSFETNLVNGETVQCSTLAEQIGAIAFQLVVSSSSITTSNHVLLNRRPLECVMYKVNGQHCTAETWVVKSHALFTMEPLTGAFYSSNHAGGSQPSSVLYWNPIYFYNQGISYPDLFILDKGVALRAVNFAIRQALFEAYMTSVGLGFTDNESGYELLSSANIDFRPTHFSLTPNFGSCFRTCESQMECIGVVFGGSEMPWCATLYAAQTSKLINQITVPLSATLQHVTEPLIKLNYYKDAVRRPGHFSNPTRDCVNLYGVIDCRTCSSFLPVCLKPPGEQRYFTKIYKTPLIYWDEISTAVYTTCTTYKSTGTWTKDAVCEVIRMCAQGVRSINNRCPEDCNTGTYIVGDQCLPHSSCSDEEVETSAPTQTSDRFCAPRNEQLCDVGYYTLFYAEETRFLCLPIYECEHYMIEPNTTYPGVCGSYFQRNPHIGTIYMAMTFTLVGLIIILCIVFISLWTCYPHLVAKIAAKSARDRHDTYSIPEKIEEFIDIMKPAENDPSFKKRKHQEIIDQLVPAETTKHHPKLPRKKTSHL